MAIAIHVPGGGLAGEISIPHDRIGIVRPKRNLEGVSGPADGGDVADALNEGAVAHRIRDEDGLSAL